MALKQLNEQQIRDWTLEEKDRWWFENVWKGGYAPANHSFSSDRYALGRHSFR